MVGQEYEALLKKYFGAWDKMDDDERREFITNADLVKYDKGAMVHNGENDCIGMLLIKSGTLRIYMLSEEGREITLFRLNEGDVCVLSASCALAEITFDVHISAEADTEVLIVNASALAAVSARNVYVECYVYKLTTDSFSNVMWAMQQILFMSFDRRLAVFLLDELSVSGGDTVHLTHEQVAKYMGSAREVVSRMLKHFANENIVLLSRGGIRITDKKKLRELARAN